MWRNDDSYIFKMIVFLDEVFYILFYISTVQEVAPTQLYKKKHDTKISMVGDTLVLCTIMIVLLATFNCDPA